MDTSGFVIDIDPRNPIRVELDMKGGRVVKGILVGDTRTAHIVQTDDGEIVGVNRRDVGTFASWPASEGTAYLGGR